MDNSQKIFTVEETAQELRVKIPTIRSWIFNGRLPVVRMGRRVFVHAEIIEKALKEGLDAVNQVGR
jgi:excisionase family DNA binding protein